MRILIFVCCALAAASAGYSAPLLYSPFAHHIPVIGPQGVPVDTPEVQHARAQHLAAHAAATPYGHFAFAPLAYGVAPALHNSLPLDTPEVAAAKAQHHFDYAVAAQRNGVHVAAPFAAGHPADTPEVQHAKAQHFAAHAAARAGLGHHYRKRRAIYGPQHLPVIGPNGVPVDTPEVQHARAAHFAALAAAGGHLGYAAPVYAAHVPAIAHNGVPLDTPEVQAAKAHHYAAHAEALSRSAAPLAYAAPYYHHYYQPHAVIGPDGHPVETPEVQALKAAHFAAHARAHHY